MSATIRNPAIRKSGHLQVEEKPLKYDWVSVAKRTSQIAINFQKICREKSKGLSLFMKKAAQGEGNKVEKMKLLR